MSQCSQTEANEDNLRNMIQKSLDNHRRLMEEIERLETAIDDVNKATVVLENEVRQSEDMLTLKSIQLQSVYDEIKTTRRSVERLNHSCFSTKQQCATLERQLRQETSTITTEVTEREKAVEQTEELVERAHAMFDSADWVIDIRRRLKELAEIEARNAEAEEEMLLAQITHDKFQAFIKEQNELPFEEFVVSVAAMRLENDAIWRQVKQHMAIIERLEAKEAEIESGNGYYEEESVETVVRVEEPKMTVEQAMKRSGRYQKAVEQSPGMINVREMPEQERILPHPQQQRNPQESFTVPVQSSSTLVVPHSIPTTIEEEEEVAEFERSEDMIMEPGQSLVVNIGDEEMAETDQLLMLNDSELADQSIDATGIQDDNHEASSSLHAPLKETAVDLSSSQLLGDTMNESQGDLGGSFMAMFGFNNSHDSLGKGGAKGAAPFGFGFGGLDTSDHQVEDNGKKDEGGVPFSLFGF